MRLRLAVLTIIGVFCATALAADGGRWQAVVKAPRAALPDVAITLGYPGYAPIANSPIELRAVARTRFNGYIGFHFAVGKNATGDVRVMSRAQIRPGGSWMLSTWARIERDPWARAPQLPLNREIVIQWRDADLHLIGQVSAGVPPWSAGRPLLVSRDTSVAGRRLGLPAVVMPPDALDLRAQWYTGFSAMVISVADWVDLPSPVRDAVIGSNLRLVTFGFPRKGQQVSGPAAAMLPVDFVEGAGSYVVPWPYAPAALRAAAPLSWRVKRSAHGIARGTLPPLVIGAGRSWAASEELLGQPLPAVSTIPLLPHGRSSMKIVAADALAYYRAFLAALLLLVFAVAFWLAIRRHPRIAVVMVLVLAGISMLAARSWLASRSSMPVLELVSDLGDGLVLHTALLTDAGAAPIAAAAVTPALARTAAFAVDTDRLRTELRTSDSPAGFGATVPTESGWDAVARRWSRREVGGGAAAKVVSTGPGRLVVDFEAPEPIDYVTASWFAGGRRWYGETQAEGLRKGRLDVAAEQLWPSFEGIGWQYAYGVQGADSFVSETVDVHFFRRSPGRWMHYAWREPRRDPSLNGRSFRMGVALVSTAEGRFTGSLLIPPGAIPQQLRAKVNLYGNLAISSLTLTTAEGTLDLRSSWQPRPVRSDVANVALGEFLVDAAALRTLAGGGVLVLTADPAGPASPGAAMEAVVTFQEKKS